MPVVRKILRTKIAGKTKRKCFYKIVPFVARKNRLSFKIKNLIILPMIILK